METAPLTLAHTHARNAVLETRKSNPVAASEEHDLAAGEFSSAFHSSSDREALRTLHLLESHHKKLAEILRFQHENPSSPAVGETIPPASTATSRGLNAQQPTIQQHPPRLAGSARRPARETPSSIASNLASARGIPAHPHRGSPASPTLSAQQAGARMTESPTRIRTATGESKLRGGQTASARDRPSRVSAPKQPWSPPSISPTEITSQQVVPADAVESPRQKGRASITEEPFQRFYSTFEGLISKLSAPLAFAGLPLGTGSPSQAVPSMRKSSADTRLDRQQAIPHRPSTSVEPDISKLFSKAALRAVRDGNGGTNNTAESFYVVPTTGGTVSYAGILSRAEKEGRRSSIDEGGDEDFVDARETPSSPELRHSGIKSRTSRPGPGSSSVVSGDANNNKLTSLQNPKTMEELQMENQALKHLSDTLSKRLHMWEVNAQSSSIALQQSLRAMHYNNPSAEHHPHRPSAGSAATSPTAALPSSSSAGAGAGAGADPSSMTVADNEQRVWELEELIRQNKKEIDHVGRENEKLRNILGKYRERWEKLKEGAKTRRAETQAPAQQQQSKNEDTTSATPPPTAATTTRGGFPASEKKLTDSNVQGEEIATPKFEADGEAGNTSESQETARPRGNFDS